MMEYAPFLLDMDHMMWTHPFKNLVCFSLFHVLFSQHDCVDETIHPVKGQPKIIS